MEKMGENIRRFERMSENFALQGKLASITNTVSLPDAFGPINPKRLNRMDVVLYILGHNEQRVETNNKLL